MLQVPLERQAQTYWRTGHDLRLAREEGRDDGFEMGELADLAWFSTHPRLRLVCLSRLRCEVTEARSPA